MQKPVSSPFLSLSDTALTPTNQSITCRCRAHVPLRSFDSAEQALAFYARVPGSSAAPPSPSRRLDLNSTTDWKFRLFDKPESLPAGVTSAEFDDKDWAKVRKNGCGGGGGGALKR